MRFPSQFTARPLLLLPLLPLLLTGCGDNSPDSVSPQSELTAAAPPQASLSSEPAPPQSDPTAATAAFHAWLDGQYEELLAFSPLAQSRLGDKSQHGELDDVSEGAQERRLQWQRDSVAAMAREFDRALLDDQGRLSWDLWFYRLERAEADAPFRRHQFIFGRNGPQSGLPRNLITYHSVDDEGDMEDYIARLNQSGRYLRQYLTRAQAAAAAGIRAPYFDYDRAVSEIDRVLSGEPFTRHGEASALWQDFTDKLDRLAAAGGLQETQAETYRARARVAMLETLQPAYEEVRAWLTADRAQVADIAEGAWSLPNGEDYYQTRLHAMTTLPLTAREVHDTGLAEVARIQAEMEGIKQQVGFAGSLREFFTFMREDDQFYLPDTAAGRQEYLARATAILATMEERLPDYFGILPRAELVVRRVEPYREIAGGAAHYVRGAVDGSRPGVFYAHLIDMRAVAVNRLENLAYHEGLPGHHMQLSIQQELTGIPRFRAHTGYTAYSEGWGLYAEYLGKEMGGYGDPYADFGRLSGEIWRAVRLVVDTGIHAFRWTEAEAVDYALANSPRPAASVRSEIRRYFNNPAQATAYKVGMMAIQDARARAEAALGSEFDIRGFHDLILGAGPLPLAMLDARVDAWSAAR